ncbi:hypothetical protein HW511_04240 [Asaia siamensis]|nr:hypothetical protein [Asaia siamensis]
MNQQILNDLVDRLEEDAFNYSVFLKYYDVSLPASVGRDIIIKAALGSSAKLGGIQKAEKASVWPTLKSNLMYWDKYGGPAAASIQSDRFLALLENLENEVRHLVEAADTIEAFWLETGHPAYPVFRDFAYLFQSDASAGILVGSSSD